MITIMLPWQRQTSICHHVILGPFTCLFNRCFLAENMERVLIESELNGPVSKRRLIVISAPTHHHYHDYPSLDTVNALFCFGKKIKQK